MRKECRLFVCNIDFNITEADIIQKLETVGSIVSFQMIYDRNTEKSKGYCFCEYETPEVAHLALKHLKFGFNGRPVKIYRVDRFLPEYQLKYLNNSVLKENEMKSDRSLLNESEMFNKRFLSLLNKSEIPKKCSFSSISEILKKSSVSSINRIAKNSSFASLNKNKVKIDLMISVLDSCNSLELKEVLEILRKIALEDPLEFQLLLYENPQLIIPVFYTLLRLNLIKKEAISTLIDTYFDLEQESVNEDNETDFDEYFKNVKDNLVKLKQYLKLEDLKKSI